MPRRDIRIVVELNLHAVTAPGVWLPSKEDVYLSVSMFGQYRRTRMQQAIFPLFVHQKFRFEKTYYTALAPSDIVGLLEDEPVLFELIQQSEFTVGGVRLASFATDTRDFLYPYPSLAPSYTPTEREILLNRTINFPVSWGISPKVEFSSRVSIREASNYDMDALEDAIQEQKAALKALRRDARYSSPRRSRSRHRYDKPTVSSVIRSRSPSPSFIKRFDDCSLDSDYDIKPPFVVKKLDDGLIGRKPGSPVHKSFLSEIYGEKPKTRRRSRSLSRRRSSTDDIDWLYTPRVKRHYRVKEVVRDPYKGTSRPFYSSRLINADSDDEEVADLLSSRTPSYPRLSRPRSVSPVSYRRAFSDRYADPYFSPRLSERISDRVDSALRRSNSLVKLSRDVRSSSPSSRLYSSYIDGYDSMDDLETDFTLAKNRSLVHIDNGKYWTQKAAQYRGISHRDLFNENLRSLYSKLHGVAESSID